MNTLNTVKKRIDEENYRDGFSSLIDSSIIKSGFIVKEFHSEKLESPLLNRYLGEKVNKSNAKNNKLAGFNTGKALYRSKGNKTNDSLIKRLLKSDRQINAGYYIEVLQGRKITEPIIINPSTNHDKPFINEKNLIFVGENSHITIVLDYISADGMDGIHNAVTELYVEDNAEVNIIKLQRQNNMSYNFDFNYAEVFNRGVVNWFSIELGSKSSYSNYYTDLKDDGSQASLSTIFFGDGESKYDFSYTMEHSGPHSISNIDSRGVLKDYARKTFRGKLKFNKGAVKSNGSETENVLLLDSTVNSKVIPALYCEEEDVSGQHAASAGKIKESQLYYLMSRGLSLIEAKKLLVEAALNPLIQKIPVDSVKEIVSGEIQRRLYNE